jgi:hypothetical protein
MQRKFKTDKMNNNHYVLTYALSIIHNFFIKYRKTSKIWGRVLEASAHLLSRALVSQSASENW